jgi:4-amino-4-deoxy-L-arabinose transferase-like glycosyltransferase
LDERRLTRGVGYCILAIVALRLLLAAMLPLAFDEAYYWLWSKNLAAGYLDHPPMVALVIRLGTLIGGDTELGIRVVSVLLALPATWAVWRAGAILFGARVAAVAALYFNLTLMVAAGTLIVTPDAPLIVASAFVLYFLAKVAETGRGPWWLAVGVAAGFALLSKYSALMLGAGILLWLVLVPDMRRWLRRPWPYLGGLVALALFAPVILWNADHGYASFLKQFGRAHIGGFEPRYLFEFIAAQIGIATPSIFVLSLAGLGALTAGRGSSSTGRVLIAALVWPTLIYFIVHSFHDRVEGNWLAPVYPALVVAAAAASHALPWHGRWQNLIDRSRRAAVTVGLGIFLIAALQAATGLLPLDRRDPTARVLGAGWRDLGPKIDDIRIRSRAPGILTMNYADTAWLSFYLPSHPPVVQINERLRWVGSLEPDEKFLRGPLLFIIEEDEVQPAGSDNEYRRAMAAYYQQVTEIARLPRVRRGVAIDYYVVYLVDGMKADPVERVTPKEPLRKAAASRAMAAAGERVAAVLPCPGARMAGLAATVRGDSQRGDGTINLLYGNELTSGSEDLPRLGVWTNRCDRGTP